MGARNRSRREFLAGSLSGIGAAWVAANVVGIEEAQAWVQSRAGGRSAFAFFSPAQAAEVEAVAAQIIPTDSTPGAREARVVDFIDRVLTTFDRGRQRDYVEGLAQLQSRVTQMFPPTTSFASLGAPQQIEVLTAIEQTPFFNLVRTHTITGFFASPVHGGNAGKVGWQLLGYDDALAHTPPFGYYDALPDTTSR